ncbi:hypothetical protein PanWU01x14_191640 [Parasponia andersonii]|uniref:Transmembrane protein n=1 Tax=Parasponia andersonii TaxID=3476 RepID=A0A2P5C1J6_PARAD|nr:hypothetical protein PanWU01x14_191640 [Parasponia andersonii]
MGPGSKVEHLHPEVVSSITLTIKLDQLRNPPVKRFKRPFDALNSLLCLVWFASPLLSFFFSLNNQAPTKMNDDHNNSNNKTMTFLATVIRCSSNSYLMFNKTKRKRKVSYRKFIINTQGCQTPWISFYLRIQKVSWLILIPAVEINMSMWACDGITV